MKRYLVALGLVAGLGSACSFEIPADDIVNQVAGKLSVDKDTVLAYTEVAMKQAAMASSSLKAQTAATEKPTASPQFTQRLFSKYRVWWQ